jgi:hypothetical protein
MSEDFSLKIFQTYFGLKDVNLIEEKDFYYKIFM